ncbi:ATP-binding protein [Tistrella mobilis]|uniref:ATP-binding protein n=1 Tax=Tistrella mobilis TaxID=171437 RepID=UPI0035567043
MSEQHSTRTGPQPEGEAGHVLPRRGWRGLPRWSPGRWRLIHALIVAAVAVFLLFAGVGAVQLVSAYDQPLKDAAVRAEGTARLLAEHAARTLEGVELTLGRAVDIVAAGTPPVADGGTGDEARQLQARLGTIIRNGTTLSAIWVIDREGRIYLHTGVFPAPPVDLSGMAAVQRLMLSPSAGPVAGALGDAGTRKEVFLARALTDEAGGFTGAVVAVMDADQFAALYRSASIGPHGRVMLLSTTAGGVMAVAPELPDETHQRMADLAGMVQPMPAGADRSGAGRPVLVGDGDPEGPWVAAVAPVHGRDMEVAVLLATADALGGWRASVWRTAGLTLIVAAGLACTVLIARSTVSRPLDRLCAAVRRVEQGSFDRPVGGSGGIREIEDAMAGIEHLRLSLAHLTDHLNAEVEARTRELEERSQQFNAALENVFLGLAMFDGERRLVVCNQRYRELFGLSEDLACRGTTLHAILEHAARAEGYVVTELGDILSRRLARLATREIRTWSEELRDGRMLDQFVRPLASGGALVAVQDVTEQRRFEQALMEAKMVAERANRAKSEFLANMSHELRTPLNAIIGFSEIIGAEMFGPVGNPRYASYGRDIATSGRHLLTLINDILDLSKAESGRMSVAVTDVSPARLAETCLRMIETQAQENGVRLVTEVPEDLPRLRTDERRLVQVLINLLSNAVKFTPRDGMVSMRASIAGDRLILVVEDTGIGMTPDEIEVALSVFGQIESAMHRHHHGTGLGLPLAARLVELLGGRFDLTSTPGVGTRAVVVLPLDGSTPASVRDVEMSGVS